jgi:hypothetical protein
MSEGRNVRGEEEREWLKKRERKVEERKEKEEK